MAVEIEGSPKLLHLQYSTQTLVRPDSAPSHRSLNQRLESWLCKLHHGHGAAARHGDQPPVLGDMNGGEHCGDGLLHAPAHDIRGRIRRLSLFEKTPTHHGTEAVLGTSCEHIAPEETDGDKAIVDFSADHRNHRVVVDPQEIEQYHQEQTMHLQTYLRAGRSSGSMDPNTHSLIQRDPIEDHSTTERSDANSMSLIDRLCMVEPWFHCKLSRTEAESMIRDTGSRDGAYLVRTSRRLRGAMVMSMAHNNKVYHYPIIVKSDGNGGTLVTMDNHTQFKNIQQLIDFYQLNRGVLPTKLNKYVTRVISVSR